MDLFVVNRYESEGHVEAESIDNHLADLLKRIETKKKERAALESQKLADEEEKSIQQPPRKKAKKTKSQKKQEIQKLQENVETQETGKNAAAEVENDVTTSGKDFMVLGTGAKKVKKTVGRVLPHWLANPHIISSDLGSGPNLEDAPELDDKLVEILRSNGVGKLFPVQASIVTWLLKCNKDRNLGRWPRNTCVSAPTGSGKTLAYVLPVVQQLQSRFVPKIACLVVLPVQELAAQVYKVFVTYSAHTNLRVALISGASSFEAEQMNLVKKSQRGQTSSRVDIVVATPGRLIDHIEKTDGFSLEDLEFLIIDEADRSTDWLRYIPSLHSRAPPLVLGNALSRHQERPAQKLLFSATLSQDPEKLSRLGLFQPILFTSVLVSDRDDDVDLDKEIENFAGRYTSPDQLTERAVSCPLEYKPIAVRQLLFASEKIEKTLIFTNSGEAAHRLAILLRSLIARNDIRIGELSAQLASKQRASVLEKFAIGDLNVLVSSDALARGLDIPGIKLVIAYDLPKHIEGYIHRAGRTARGGIAGTAISIVTPNQTPGFTKMLSSSKKNVPEIEDLGNLEKIAEEIDYGEHIERLKATLEEKKQSAIAAKGKSSKRRGGAASKVGIS